MRRRFAAASLVGLLFAGCGGGSSAAPPAVDLTGSWSIAERATGTCAGVSYPQVRSYEGLVVQSGSELRLSSQGLGAAWRGTLAGHAVSWSASRADSGGTLSIAFSGTAAEDGNAFGGSATWTWTGAGTTCGGTGTVTGTRAPAPAPFGAPTWRASQAGNAQVTLWWNAVTGATRYRLYRSTSPDLAPATGELVVTMVSGGTIAGFTDGRLTNGTTYSYVVTAVDALRQESPASAVASATPSAALPRPAAPAILSATAGSRSVTVTHGLVPGATSYLLYYATTADPLSSYAALPRHAAVSRGGTEPLTVTDLEPGATYFFAVTAQNIDGESEPSAVLSATPAP